MSISTEAFPSGSVMALENFLLDYPEEAVGTVILRSQDSYDFRVPKLYIIHTSPKLREELLSSPNPQPTRSIISAEPNVEGTANAHRVVRLPVHSTILISLLSYIFPVRPILPSTTDQIMELLSVAQMFKMDVVLTHIRNHIAQQQPPFIRKETAYFVYALAQKHGLRAEALQAARCTLNFSVVTLENLVKEDKLGLMPGTSLHELWKYHQRVRSNFTTDIEELKESHLDELNKIQEACCESFDDSDLPYWLDICISKLKDVSVPVSLDFTNFHMEFVEHSQGLNTKLREECSCCSSIFQDDIRALYDVFLVVFQGSIAKAELDFAVGDEGTRSENEFQARLSMEAPFLPKYSDMPNADVILQSSDLVNFRAHRSVLIASSPFFRDMLSLPQPANDIAPDGLPVLRLSEVAEVLDSLISMLYPVPPEMPSSIDNILALLAATDKYDMSAVQSFIREEVSRRGLLSPTDSSGVLHMYAVACNKRLGPEMETAARLSLNYSLTFEGVGEELRLLDGWALRSLADFRLRCVRDLVSRMKSFSDGQNGPSKIWAGCPSVDDPLNPPWWLYCLFQVENSEWVSFAEAVPTSLQFRHEFLESLQDHINEKDCHFCLKVYTLKGEGYCAEMCEMLEQARNIPTQILGGTLGV